MQLIILANILKKSREGLALSKRRVVVTGLGIVSPLGLNVDDTWAAILKSKSGVSMIEHFDVSQYTTRFSATVKNFNVDAFVSHREARKMDTFIHYALAATYEAINDAQLEIKAPEHYRIGVSIGSGIGGLPMIERCHEALLNLGPRKISPFFVPSAIVNMAAGQVSIHFGLRGPNVSVVSACTTGTHNIGYATRTIAYGDADVMIAGGTEMATCPMGVAGFAAARALSKRNDEPERASRPWDKQRDGFVLGDGAAVLVLEEYEHAKRRGAKIYAECIGFGMSSDAYHMTSPDENGDGAYQAILNAIRDAQISPDEIDYINAHATSTVLGDVVEIRAIKRAFGNSLSSLAVSSTKSMTGHLIAAAGSIEAIFSILAIRDQVVPPTINLDEPEEECTGLNLVPHEPQSKKIRTVLSNSFGFGGTNGTVIFRAI